MTESESTNTIAVIGSGLAGMVCAVDLSSRGFDVVLLESSHAPGGTSMLSAGWIWRYTDVKTWRWAAPRGREDIYKRIHANLPSDLVWLERNGVRHVANGTGNRLTEGIRIEPAQAFEALERRLPMGCLQLNRKVVGAKKVEGTRSRYELEIATPRAGGSEMVPRGGIEVDAIVFAGGGYGSNFTRISDEAGVPYGVERSWVERNCGNNDGSSAMVAERLGAATTDLTGECYVRLMPRGLSSRLDWRGVRSVTMNAFSQPYGEHAVILDADGHLVPREKHDWSDSRRLWQLARRTGRGWLLVNRESLKHENRYGTILSAIRHVLNDGGNIIEGSEGELLAAFDSMGLTLRGTAKDFVKRAVCAVEIEVGITHTIGGLEITRDARLSAGRLSRSGGLYAAGVDAGGVAGGGYFSGLAQALCLGRVAAASAADGASRSGRRFTSRFR